MFIELRGQGYADPQPPKVSALTAFLKQARTRDLDQIQLIDLDPKVS